jgi:hypothetical protein
MSIKNSSAMKAIELARNQASNMDAITMRCKTPDAILESDAKNKAFAKEYERFKTNQYRFTNMMVTPDSFPLMCELFDALKKHLNKMSDQDIWDCNSVVRVPYFGRTWTITFLFTGMVRRNEIYLSIGYPEPIHTAMAIIAFDIPEHWEF